MRIGLYPLVAGTLVIVWLLVEILGDEINSAPTIIQIGFLILTILVGIGAILVVMWDTGCLGKGGKNGQ